MAHTYIDGLCDCPWNLFCGHEHELLKNWLDCYLFTEILNKTVGLFIASFFFGGLCAQRRCLVNVLESWSACFFNSWVGCQLFSITPTQSLSTYLLIKVIIIVSAALKSRRWSAWAWFQVVGPYPTNQALTKSGKIPASNGIRRENAGEKFCVTQNVNMLSGLQRS